VYSILLFAVIAQEIGSFSIISINFLPVRLFSIFFSNLIILNFSKFHFSFLNSHPVYSPNSSKSGYYLWKDKWILFIFSNKILSPLLLLILMLSNFSKILCNKWIISLSFCLENISKIG